MFHKERDQIKFQAYIGISNVTIDLCKFFGGEDSHMLLDIFAGEIHKYGNIMQPCPLTVKWA